MNDGLRLADPAASRAVLIGVHAYEHLPPLPAVENNLEGLEDAFTTEAVWGLPPQNVIKVSQPKRASDVIDAVIQACQQATDTVVIYYAGHGLNDDEFGNELYLALPESRKHRPDTACAFDHLRREIRRGRADGRQVVVILDCCYSGRAIPGGMSPGEDLADLANIALDRIAPGGASCVLTASSAGALALAPVDAHYTAFTQALIALLYRGIPGGAPLLHMAALHDQLLSELRANGLPQPTFGTRGTANRICIAKNAAKDSNDTAGSSAVDLERIGGVVRDHFRSRPAHGVFLVETAFANKEVKRACNQHRLGPGEKLIALWLVRLSLFRPTISLAFTSTGLRIAQGNTHLFVPYRDFGQYHFSSPVAASSHAAGVELSCWLDISGPQRWSSTTMVLDTPSRVRDCLRRIQHLVTA
ncbi:caspase family protein [Streptomyces sp. NPDC001851]|uniref:caspase family protein n=1 Tax=Streptomyces sp. NPDC001851 TaxID=3154529 RepID=UPI003326AB08